MNGTPFEQVAYDSGYFLSNRERDIAEYFFKAGKAAGDETKRALLEVLEGLHSDSKGNFCCCSMRISHPDTSSHSKFCQKAQALIAKAKGTPL